MRISFALLLIALLSACATPPAAPRHDALFHDALFAAPTERVAADDVFALSEPMRRYLKVDIADQLRSRGPQAGLIEALYSKGQLRLDYDAAVTRNAADAFAARSGNCLSLVIMTAALAKELGLQVRFMSAYLEESWSRSGNLLLRSGHVNITLGHRIADADRYRFANLRALNFVIRGLLQEGVAASTRQDAQAKSLGEWLRARVVDVPASLLG